MLFSISVSFTYKHVNHTVIFELKKLYIKKNNYELDELGAKMTVCLFLQSRLWQIKRLRIYKRNTRSSVS